MGEMDPSFTNQLDHSDDQNELNKMRPEMCKMRNILFDPSYTKSMITIMALFQRLCIKKISYEYQNDIQERL